MQREHRQLFPPLQALIITQTNHPPGDFIFVKSNKSSDFCGVFRDSKARITLQLVLLCSTSSGCCREPLSRPTALTGGQCLSSLALQSEQRGDTHTPPRPGCKWNAHAHGRRRYRAGVNVNVSSLFPAFFLRTNFFNSVLSSTFPSWLQMSLRSVFRCFVCEYCDFNVKKGNLKCNMWCKSLKRKCFNKVI